MKNKKEKVITWFIGRTEPPAGPGLEEPAVGRDGQDADHQLHQTHHLEGVPEASVAMFGLSLLGQKSQHVEDARLQLLFSMHSSSMTLLYNSYSPMNRDRPHSLGSYNVKL